jgi:two-component system, sensor histidine kinase RegB
VRISDDGPGFAPEIIGRIGEPYVTTQRYKRRNVDIVESEGASGLGLGCFIAKTLLERSGASVEFENRASPNRGAMVRVQWTREDFERETGIASNLRAWPA